MRPEPLAQRGMGHEDEMVERAAGERHAAGEGGRLVAGQAERTLLHPDRRGKAGVDLDELELGERPPDGAGGGASQHLHGGPCLQAPAGGQGDRLRTMQGHVREEPAVGGDPRRGGACSAEQINNADDWSTVHWLACQTL